VRLAFYGNFGCSYSSESHHAASLESLGHEVIRVQEPERNIRRLIEVASGPIDMFVWVKTHGWETPGMEQVIQVLRDRRIPVVSYHLDLYLPIAERWARYRNDPYMMGLDHFFTVDPKMADWLNENTPVRGHFIPAGVYDRECYISDLPSPHANDVVFVGSKNYHDMWKWRPELIAWLRATYGDRFTHVGGDGDTGTLRGEELNRMYANSKVAVGDTLCPDFDYPFYASDRLFEAPGRGAFQIFPRIEGIQTWFGGLLKTFNFGDFDGLKDLIDFYLEHDEDREALRRMTHDHVKKNHTYVQRWETILKTVFPC
jgi:hypothetical protein